MLDVVTATDETVQFDRLDASLANGYVTEGERGYGVVTRTHVVAGGPLPAAWASVVPTGILTTVILQGCRDPACAITWSERRAGLCPARGGDGPRSGRGTGSVMLLVVRLALRAARLSLDDIKTRRQSAVVGDTSHQSLSQLKD